MKKLKIASNVLFFIFILITFLKVNKTLARNVDFGHYARVDCWIKSSICTLLTSSFLTTCDQETSKEKLTPIEGVSIADDRGHTLVSNFFALIFRKPIDKHDLVYFNLIVNILGFSLFYFYLLAKNPIASIGFVLIFYSTKTLINHPSPDVTFIYPGITFISIWGCFLLQKRFRENKFTSSLKTLIIFFIGSLFRESIFFASAIGFMIFNFCAAIWRKDSIHIKLLATGLLLFLVSKISNPVILNIRDVIWETKPTAFIKGHGISHNLFIGLGTEKNSWNIKWDDSNADMFAKQEDPNVIYCSEKYYSILMKKYIQFISENPGEAAYIYIIKSLKAFHRLLKSLTLIHYLIILLYFSFFVVFRINVNSTFFYLLAMAGAHLVLPVLTAVSSDYLQSALVCWHTAFAFLLLNIEKQYFSIITLKARKYIARKG